LRTWGRTEGREKGLGRREVTHTSKKARKTAETMRVGNQIGPIRIYRLWRWRGKSMGELKEVTFWEERKARSLLSRRSEVVERKRKISSADQV